MNNLQRRTFLKKSAAVTGFTVLPSYLVTGKPGADGKLPPSKRINLGVIGTGGRANGVVPGVCKDGKAEVTAWCDVDFKRGGIEKNLQRAPKAKQFQDFRLMLEKMGKDVDAVTICTPDHTHFPAAMLAMSMGKHVYVEKPLTHSYLEADLLMKAEKKFGVVTQMGNQGHTSSGSEQFKSLVEKGVVKNITKIEAWKTPSLFFMNKDQRFSKYPSKEDQPASLDWDLWCGPAEKKPFSSKYHPFNWRAFYLYGNGMLGDWGAHIIDFAHHWLELGQPHKVTPILMDDHNDVLFPLSSHLKMEFAARGELPAAELIWRDGADCKPKLDEKFMDKGEDGKLTTPKLGGAGTILYPEGADYAITRGSHSGTSNIINSEKRHEMRMHLRAENPKFGHQNGFTAACLGESCSTQSNFQVAGSLTKTMMLGIACQTLNEALEFDTEKEEFTGSNKCAANALLQGPAPRKGWEQFYKMV